MAKFIVFEGPDRGGKSTQANLLRKYLEAAGYNVLQTREPGGTPVSEGIRKILLDPENSVSPRAELLLYEASRAQHTEEKILPALQEDKIVICERYTMSTCAYQGYGRGFDMDLINTVNNIATHGLQPDLTFVFLMSDKYFTERGEYLFSDRLELEGNEFREKMRQGYKELVKITPNAVLIDADNTVEEIHAKVLGHLKEFNIL
ncbi:Thymidylate kinase [Elusimicrobium minutum Pei191]|uniref:Thymidylate kinase n=1 Tax=Elusimicrobium minutum (strain Pei191) TaxID=445932 RepID=B2KER3_ELUMP|nr:dTMP kinase [Elusimicrobium minutum]ACC99009.1 Thymidylate kinase [Elusimicrobium minutum Pei191]